MVDFLDVLARDAKENINEGYYEAETQIPTPFVSLKKAILESEHNSIIAEIKTASPSLGPIRKDADVEEIAVAMEDGGAMGISILTEPEHFGGSLFSITKVRRSVKLPLLMKDIIVSTVQLDAASKIGANAVLLVEALFERGYCECDVNEMIAHAQSNNLEALLEVHSEDEFSSALKTEADIIGINNRDLKTLKVDLGVTEGILEKIDSEGRTIVSESGVKTPADLRFLRECGVHAFLIGSAIMIASDIQKKVKEFVAAL
jgi:indole-3-glycerol phosphate synthase